MGTVKNSKRRWKRIPNDLRVTCYTGACTHLTRVYCRSDQCRQPHCDEHKGLHVLQAHTMQRLYEHAGSSENAQLHELPPDRQIELLSLYAKIRNRKGVSEAGFEPAEGGFLAWAKLRDGTVEVTGARLEEALHDLNVKLKAQGAASVPPRNRRPAAAAR